MTIFHKVDWYLYNLYRHCCIIHFKFILGAATDPNEDFSGEIQHHTIVENNIEVNIAYFY